MNQLVDKASAASLERATLPIELKPDGRNRWDGALGVGTAVIAGLSILLARSQPARASDECLAQPHCCSLATCTPCNYNVSHDRFYCPAGYNRFTWSCMEGSQLAWCGECTTSTTSCYQGTFNCSCWFWN